MKYERKDAHYRRAKAEGFRARSAYKLADLDDRHRLLRKGDRVVDLGAWPGGWLQVALDRVGSSGRVVGVDLVAIEPFAGRPVETIVGDVRDAAVVEEIRTRLGGPANVVLSDLAPKLTGIRATDEARCEELVATVVRSLSSLLAPGGRALLKIFMDSNHRETIEALRRRFGRVTTTRPDASRRGSAELYVVASDFRG